MKNLNRALLVCFIFLQTSMIFCRVATPSNNLDSFLSTLGPANVEPKVAKHEHSNGQIALFLQKQTSTQEPSQAVKVSNKMALQSFLQTQSNPLYQQAMAILSNKQLLSSYQKAISSISLFFFNYSAKNLQHFHVKSSAPTNSLASLLGGIKNVAVAKPVNHGDQLASFLSTLSVTSKKPVG